jgi:uncharacterized protein (TIGR02145 family)
MAENLNCDVSGSWCYGNDPSNCATYGRLYDWSTAMNLPSSCNSSSCASQIQSKHRGICPEGWHIPTNDEWSTLESYVGGSDIAGRKLKATSGWNSCGPSGSGSSYVCEDAFGFSALPGGYRYADGIFYSAGNYGYWWCASEDDARYACYRNMSYFSDFAYWYYYDKADGFSVRCLQD